MAILAECPGCRKKQSIRNKVCKACGADLDKAKRSGRVEYWIDYRLPGGKQRREKVGTSIEEAKAAEGKRRGQKREGRIFDILPESKITFAELANWYLDFSKVQALRSYDRIIFGINRFNERLGGIRLSDIKNIDLEEYQNARAADGAKPATIDYELSVVKTMVEKAFVNDKIDGVALKAFKKTGKLLRVGSNARDRVITIPEFIRILSEAAQHMRYMMIVAINTGMRPGEIRGLTWGMVDRRAGFLRLPADLTKEKAPKRIPINHNVASVLGAVKPSLSLVGDTHHQHVFTYQGRPITSPGGLRRSFKYACDKAGVLFGQDTHGGVVFKDIRRTVKTNMVSAGVDKVYRDTILGHSLKGMDVHYIKPSEAELTDAMECYTAWLDREIESAFVDQTVDQKLKKGLANLLTP